MVMASGMGNCRWVETVQEISRRRGKPSLPVRVAGGGVAQIAVSHWRASGEGNTPPRSAFAPAFAPAFAYALLLYSSTPLLMPGRVLPAATSVTLLPWIARELILQDHVDCV